MRIVTVLSIVLLSSFLLQARTLSYESIHAMPKSVEKDYYIWRYILSPKSSKQEAQKLIKETFRINGKLAKAYKKKTGHKAPVRSRAKSRPSKKEVATYKKKIKATLDLLKKDKPFQEWLKLPLDMKIFVFNHAGKSGRKMLDRPISGKLFAQLSTDYSFNDSIYRIKKEHLPNWRKNLLHLPAKNHKLSYASLVKLGFIALYEGRTNIAETYFVLASKKAQDRDDLDKALFWAYISNNNKKYLKSLVNSYEINVYTLMARDILHLKYPSVITPSLPKAHLMDKEISDPIFWARLKKKIFSKKYNLKSLAQEFKSAEAIGYYTYIMAKASREKDQYFPMPYRDILSKLPKSRQAILYAIARQESRFVPASISVSYALGMMQFMPFLVRHIAKQRGEKVDYDSMFDPRKALIYANEHMNYLTKWLKHPLFIAYAYNAGIGYTRRLIRKEFMFNGKGPYEPYISLELVDNDQARHYGKRVLANYVIYMNKLGVPLRITDLLKTLHLPEKTDNFRKRKHKNG